MNIINQVITGNDLHKINKGTTTSNLIENRQIRVFISSTFRDMQDERDELMKKTFPILRKKAAERDVTLTELDLRWGITEEEAKSGKVVEICLREIENSVPFFIGIIGNRYGWVPGKNDIGCNIIDRFSQVGNYLDQHISVTEMEMQFGVLSRPEDMHAFFYIKEQEEDGVENLEMLKRLKGEVLKSKYPSSTYHDVQDLGRQVEAAFEQLLDDVFPQKALTELERERIGHHSFLNQLSQTYVRDEHNFDTINNWVDGQGNILVVTGASGLGKSALVANWVKEKLQDESFNKNIIYHFTGNGGSESDYHDVVKRLINEIRDIYHFERVDEEKYDDDATELDVLCQRIDNDSNARPLILVIDAINQILDEETESSTDVDEENICNPKDLQWLPLATDKVKLLITTLENDRTMTSLKEITDKNGTSAEVFVLQPLDHQRRINLVNAYLHKYSKTLLPSQVERIVSDSQCHNTLVLKTVLDELVNFGIFERLDEKIDFYLGAETVPQFYQAFLQSYENDFGKDLMRHAMSLIAVSRDGLSENELMNLLHINQLTWSQLYCSLHAHINMKGGQINFSHYYISNAVKKRYLSDTESNYRMQCKRKLLKYFQKKTMPHAIREFVYQAISLEAYDELCEYVNKQKVVEYYLEHDRSEFTKIWTNLFDEILYEVETNWGKSKESIETRLKLAEFLTNKFDGDGDDAAITILEECEELLTSKYNKKNSSSNIKNYSSLLQRTYLLITLCLIHNNEDFDETKEKYERIVKDSYGDKSKEYADAMLLFAKNILSADNDSDEALQLLLSLADKYEAFEDNCSLLQCLMMIADVRLYSSESDCVDYYKRWIDGVKHAYPYGSKEHETVIVHLENLRDMFAQNIDGNFISFFDSFHKKHPEYTEQPIHWVETILPSLYKLTGDMEQYLDMPKILKLCHNKVTKSKCHSELKIDESVTHIPQSMFVADSSITELVIPDWVKSIGKFSFKECPHLSSVYIPDTVEYIGDGAFAFCKALVSVRLSKKANIAPDMFRGCKSLANIDIMWPKNIGNDAFQGCSALTSIDLTKVIDSNNGLQVGDRAFKDCYRLVEVKTSTIGQGIDINTAAFQNCCRLQPIDLKELSFVAGDAFDGTSMANLWENNDATFKDGILDIHIPDDADSSYVDASAYKGRNDINEVYMNENVQGIATEAFKDCHNLQRVHITRQQQENHDIFDSNWFFLEERAFENCTSLEEFDYPDGTETTGEYAFCGCINLNKVTIPNTVSDIDLGTFKNCKSLNHVEIPKSVTTIGESVFVESSVTALNVPATVRSIAKSAFTGIQELTLNYTSLEDLEIAVDCCDEPWKTVLIVPQGTEDMYRQHPYFDQFKEIREF